MTPKEKAKELFNKYCYAIRTEETDSGYFTNVIYAKNCSLIAVDEILKAIPNEYLDVWQGEANMVINEDLEYWQEVKNELEKL
jgi:hypothetical protein